MYEFAALYAFTPIDDPPAWRDEVRAQAQANGLLGVIIIAGEGINATVCGEPEGLARWESWLRTQPGLEDVTIKRSQARENGFGRLSIRVREELVPLGIDVDPNTQVGTYVDPKDWDALISREDVTLIDCRNSYEIEVGTFEGAIDPGTQHFREFADYAHNLDPNTPVAMFCTGGIRCEKATSMLKALEFEHVYHLRGGILGYLESQGAQTSTWQGECFVFDKRASVDASLAPGQTQVCWGCRMPLSPADLESEHYEEGVSCARCYEDMTEPARQARRDRHRHMTQRRSS